MYEKGILKEGLFHGIHQDLRDSIQFCYKKAETTYDELLNGMLDAEWEKSTEMKTNPLKGKSAVTTAEEPVKGLVDSGAQISAISMEFVKRHKLPIFQLQQLLDFEGFWGCRHSLHWVHGVDIRYTRN